MIEINNIQECIEYLQDIDVVIFDLDDTLANEIDYVKSGFEAVAKAFPQISDCYARLFSAFTNKERPFDKVLNEAGLFTEDNLKLMLDSYRNHKPNTKFISGAEECLKVLRAQGKKLGVITDGRVEAQQAKIDALKLQSFVDKIIITDSLGIQFRKPNPKAYEMMQEYFNVPYAKMAYIGDNKSKDFIAPETLGMRAIHVNNVDGLYG